VDGVIFLQDVKPDILEILKAAGLPFALLDSHRNTADIPRVCCDYTQASFRAVKYLISNGHRKIAFIGMSNINEYYLSSFNGYMKALEEAGLPSNPEWVTSALQEPDSAAEAALRLTEASELPDAIFCTADLIAIYAMKALVGAGFAIPEKISVCAVDNIMPAQFCTPALTTVDIDKKSMGRAAVDLIMELIEGGDTGETVHFERIIASGEIIVRESVLNKT